MISSVEDATRLSRSFWGGFQNYLKRTPLLIFVVLKPCVRSRQPIDEIPQLTRLRSCLFLNIKDSLFLLVANLSFIFVT